MHWNVNTIKCVILHIDYATWKMVKKIPKDKDTEELQSLMLLEQFKNME